MQIILVIILLVLAAIGLSYVDFGRNDPEPQAGPPAAQQSALSKMVAANAGVAVGGPFRLQDDQGREVTEQSLVGSKHHLIFFGFANCPDICPGMLQTVAWVLDNLSEAQRARVQMVFVSVDPDRDTLEELGGYVRSFHKDFIAWTGPKAEIDRMVKGYLAYYSIRSENADVAAAPADYQVDHSAFLYLMGPDGRYRRHFRSSDSAESLREALAAALG